MKFMSFFLVSIAAMASFAQEDYKYYGYDRESGEIYPSKVYVDSCPRSKYPECPRKAEDFYTTFIGLALGNKIESKLTETALERINTYGEIDDRAVLSAAQATIVALNGQAIKQKLNKSQTVFLMMKDDRLSNVATFNAIVRLISAMDKIKK